MEAGGKPQPHITALMRYPERVASAPKIVHLLLKRRFCRWRLAGLRHNPDVGER